MTDRSPLRRLTLADNMILVASIAGLVAVIPGIVDTHRMGPVPAAIQATLNAAAVFFSLGGLGACAARLRGRPRFEGFCWAFVCGPFGLLLFALMPRDPED